MRVLVVSNLFPPEFIGGYELAAADLATRLAEDGHAVLVLTAPMAGETPDGDWPFALSRSLQCVTQSPDFIGADDARLRGGTVNIANLKALGLALASFAPDVALCGNLAGLGPFGLLKLLDAAGIATALYLADDPFAHGVLASDELRGFLAWFGLGDALARLAILPMSDGILREVSRTVGTPLRGLVTVPGWVDDRRHPPPAPLDTDERPPRFVFSSRIAPHKGIGLVLEAAALVRERGGTDFTIDLYGAGEVALTLQRAQMAGLGDVVRYAGSKSKPDMVALFAGYDALLFPTWEREPFGFVAAEAAFGGCVPIMTSTCGAAEWFRDGVDCIKIERSATALADAMVAFRALPPPARATLRADTRRAARALFRFEPWYGRIRDALASLPRRERAPDIAAVVNALVLQFRVWFA